MFSQFDDMVSQLESDFESLTEKLNESASVNSELKAKLAEASATIARLRIGLDQIGDRMQSSNEWLAEAYEELDELDKQIAVLTLRISMYESMHKRSIIGFAVGGVTIGIGSAFVGYGIHELSTGSYSTNAIITGSVVIGVGAAVWTVGYLFNWW
jgi:uncharacterized coiled-coil protein SlyX